MGTRILLLFLILLPGGKLLVAQSPGLSEESTISLLTCGPGPEVYSYFGHSALRVTDPALKIDRVYNYGTFDFNVPDFYAQFIDGKLNYMLSMVRYQGFVPDYISENRFIKELTLNISLEDRRELFNLLEINYLPENRHYWYDFFTDNCSSRIRDIVVRATGGKYLWPPEPAEHLSYRQLIMPYISLNHWARTGILLLLTAGADARSSLEGYMFLPDHLHSLFSKAMQADGSPLCQPERIIFMPEYPKPKGTGIFHPYAILTLLLILAWILAFYKKIPPALQKSFFTFLFLLSGSLGFLFCYMWFFSGHLVCHANLNLAWAFPLNLLLAAAIWIPRITKAVAIYCKAMILLVILFLATFWLWKQSIPLEAVLFCLALLPGLLRYSGLQVPRKAESQDNTN